MNDSTWEYSTPANSFMNDTTLEYSTPVSSSPEFASPLDNTTPDNMTENSPILGSQETLQDDDSSHLPIEQTDERIKKAFSDFVKTKGWAKGWTDLALLTANANQLRYVVDHPNAHFRILNTVLLSLSIFLQIIGGVLLIVEHNLDEWKDKNRFLICRRINLAISCFMFLIIVINVFVVAFGDPENMPPMPPY